MADRRANEQIFHGIEHEYFFAVRVVKGSVCVFCEGRAEEEEKVKHVGRLLSLLGVSHFCPHPPFLSVSFQTPGCFAKC